MSKIRLAVLLLTVATLLSTGVSAGQAPESIVILDQKQDIGTVSYGGTTYQIVRYNNPLPLAGGVEVFRGDRRVTSKSTVEEVFRIYGWQQSVRRFDGSDVRSLQEIRSTAEDIESTVQTPLSATNDILGVIDGLKQTTVPGSGLLGESKSVWEALTSAVPVLSGFESSVRSLRSSLRGWKETANEAEKSIPPVVDSLQKVRQGEDVDYSMVRSRFSNAIDRLDSLGSKSDSLENRISTVASTSGTISGSVSGVPAVGGSVAASFRDLEDSLDSAASDIRRFSDGVREQRDKLQDVRSTAQQRRNQLTGDWQARRDDSTAVTATLVLSFVVALVSLVAVWRSFFY